MTEMEYQQLLENQRRAGSVEAPPTPNACEPDALPESLIEAECVKLLEEDGWRSLKTDPVSRRAHGKGFGELGMADYLFIRYRPSPKDIFIGQKEPNDSPWMRVLPCQAEILWVEFKSRRGYVEKRQLAWHTAERARGALTAIASLDFPASVEGFREWYAASGLMLRMRWW